MKNRYGKELRDSNQLILELSPANQTLRTIVALEFNKIYRSGRKTLEIGCGEGDSAAYILHSSTAELDMLDASPEMISISKKRLKQYAKRTSYICEDALTYLERSSSYDIIFSEWTIHNFTWSDKRALFAAIYGNLKPRGWFIFMDKVYPKRGARELLEIQLKRYNYLPRKATCEIIAHEKQDYLDEYRMDQKQFIAALKKAGFTSPMIIDRVERDIVVIAKK